jgi:hypothetical protein
VNEQTDSQLLKAYVESRSEPVFAELVRRYTDLVYSAALRMVCDPHLAQDVTQNTFVALAKQAGQIKIVRRFVAGCIKPRATSPRKRSVPMCVAAGGNRRLLP